MISVKDVWNRLTNNCGDNSGIFEKIIIMGISHRHILTYYMPIVSAGISVYGNNNGKKLSLRDIVCAFLSFVIHNQL